MKFLLNRQAHGWLMLDPDGNRSLGLFDSEEKAMEHAWVLASQAGIDSVVYSRDSLDDDSIIVITGLKRCVECLSMRPAEDYNVDGVADLKTSECKDCREGSRWPDMVILDDASDLLAN